MKSIIYVVFATLFKVFNLAPLQKKRITFIMTYDDKFNGSLKYIYDALKENYPEYDVHIIGRQSYEVSKKDITKHPIGTLRRIFKFLIIDNYYLATSQKVLLNNIFLVLAYLKFKEEVQVIQYWHAVGTFKKFGENFQPTSKIHQLQRKANKAYTHIIVNSNQDVSIYAEAFGAGEEKVVVLGSPSTDIFFDNEKVERYNKKVRKYYGIGDKKVFLYMPTFRENENRNLEIIEYIKQIDYKINDATFMVRLHPHIYKKYSNQLIGLQHIINASEYEDENELLCAADQLITDYSSIIYEYCILERNIIFFAFDLEEYKEIRQFYHPYEEFIPGNMVIEVNELVKKLNEYPCNKEVSNFKNNYYIYRDGKSVDRFIEKFIKG